MSYQLEKAIWTDNDFDVMGWHDATVWSMLAEPDTFEFAFDLDYIFEWIHPGPDETYFKFHVATVTMMFHNVYGVRINIESQEGTIEVADLHRGDPVPTPNGKMTQREYRFACQEGEISLTATGYTMYVRSSPIHQQGQVLDIETRGGISFARIATAAM